MVIRDVFAADIPAIFELEHRPEFHTLIGTWTIEQHKRAFAERNQNCYLLLEDEEGRVAGYAILQDVFSGSVELKRLVVATPGKGWGRWLLRFTAHYAFENFKAHRLYLDVFVDNERARHVYEDFGFKVEGVMREAAFRDGEYFDLMLMSLLEDEYRTMHPEGA